ncbi:unnamed protein product [Rhizophagus irregularis]|nr:unnamed protein product [Rhizophagus irregularis]CAB5365431.1 unnamed protein product [Rhizophagus irregularis]
MERSWVDQQTKYKSCSYQSGIDCIYFNDTWLWTGANPSSSIFSITSTEDIPADQVAVNVTIDLSDQRTGGNTPKETLTSEGHF